MKVFSQDLLMSLVGNDTQLFRVRVYGYYMSDGREYTDGVSVSLTADGYTQVDDYIDVPLGTVVEYSVTKQDYDTVTKEIVVTGNTRKNIQLFSTPKWGYKITPIPIGSHVTMLSGTQGVSNATGETTYRFYSGSLVNYTVSFPGMNSVSGSKTIPGGITDDPVHDIIELTATLDIKKVVPSNATILWTVGASSSDMSITRNVIDTGGLKVSCAGYDDYELHFPEDCSGYPGSGNYLTNTTIANGVSDNTPAVILQLKQLTCYLSCTPNDATITMSVNGGPDQTATGPGELTVNCKMGDTITWSVTKPGWSSTYPTSGTWVMGPEPKQLGHVTLSANVYNFSVTAIPSVASITIMKGASVLGTGTGSCSVNVNGGDNIRYIVTYDGATTDQTINAVAENKNISVVLDASQSASHIITSDSSMVLPKGDYVAFLISGGSSGLCGSGVTWAHSSNTPGRRNARGGGGGGGGGSGRVVKFSFTTNGTDTYVFGIGAGGSRQTVYSPLTPTSGSTDVLYSEEQQMTYNVSNNSPDLRGGDTYINRNSVEVARAVGATFEQYTAVNENPDYRPANFTSTRYGGFGGNGGGVGGRGEYTAPDISYYEVGDGGQGGAKQGGNSVRTVTTGDTSGTSWTRFTYVFNGQNNQERTYANNGHAFVTQQTFAGGGGIGLQGMASQMQTSAQVSALTVQNLLDYMSGGASGTGGGASWTGNVQADWPHTCVGGPGGGGGAWYNGEDGFCTGAHPTQATPWYSGKGGAGAVILVCTAWS